MQAPSVEAAKRLADRAMAAGKIGRTIRARELDQLEVDLELSIPAWLRQILLEVPLCGLQLGHKMQPPVGDDDMINDFEWADAKDIRSESLDAYPGLAIRSLGYLNVAGNDGSGDPLFICIHDGDDPPLYQIYHDISDKGEIIVSQGKALIAESISIFFNLAVIGPK